jgi:hypothetical protein
LSIISLLTLAFQTTRKAGELGYGNVAALTTATVLHQIVHQAIYVLKVGGVRDGSSISARLDKFRCCQNIQVKGKSWPGQLKAASDFACGKALGGILDEQTKNIQARFLRESSEGIDSRGRIHISRTMEV